MAKTESLEAVLGVHSYPVSFLEVCVHGAEVSGECRVAYTWAQRGSHVHMPQSLLQSLGNEPLTSRCSKLHAFSLFAVLHNCVKASGIRLELSKDPQ